VNALSRWIGRPNWVLAGIALLASGATCFLLWMAFPPNGEPETAYFFLLPAVIWFYRKPSYRSVAAVFLVCGYVMHLAIFYWLRNVATPALYAGVLLPTLYLLVWFLLARWTVPRALAGNCLGRRLAGIALLAAAWTAIEWLRCQFALGFPWLPLAASQWQRPAILQVAPWTGAWSISFFLVFFNLAIGSYLHHLLVRRKGMQRGALFSMCPDFYVAFGIFVGLFTLFFLTQPEPSSREPMMRVGFVQPYLKDKWKPGRAVEHSETLRALTQILRQPELVLWPEASAPRGMKSDRSWIEPLATEIGRDFLVGAVTKRDGASYNSVCLVRHDEGLVPASYAKRVLVPFGEYVPFGFSWIPGLQKLVGPIGRFEAGDRPAVLPVRAGERNLLAGPLICYEDIFPQLALSTVRAGADFLFVCTNNAWFGEEGCAEQHAAHSVLRAVELRRPVIRCGNHGWSGWIDEYGNAPPVPDELNPGHSRNPLPLHVFFKDVWPTTRDSAWADQLTFYARHGDWFVYLCLAFLLPAVLFLGRKTQEAETQVA
jgi:apolipoprotein N-acyltransferase